MSFISKLSDGFKKVGQSIAHPVKTMRGEFKTPDVDLNEGVQWKGDKQTAPPPPPHPSESGSLPKPQKPKRAKGEKQSTAKPIPDPPKQKPKSRVRDAVRSFDNVEDVRELTMARAIVSEIIIGIHQWETYGHREASLVDEQEENVMKMNNLPPRIRNPLFDPERPNNRPEFLNATQAFAHNVDLQMILDAYGFSIGHDIPISTVDYNP